MTYALIVAALLASDVPLVWAARHPQAIKAAIRDTRELATTGAAWPSKFSSGIIYHRSGEAKHAKPREITTVMTIVKAVLGVFEADHRALQGGEHR